MLRNEERHDPTTDEALRAFRATRALLVDMCEFTAGAGTPPESWPPHLRAWWATHEAEQAVIRKREARNAEAHEASLRARRDRIDAELAEVVAQRRATRTDDDPPGN